MKDCVDPAGHRWSYGGTARFMGSKSTMASCLNEGCDEIGYVIEEVAQNLGREESK